MKKYLKFMQDIYMSCCRVLFGHARRKIVFSSFSGKTYSDNPKAISEAIHKIEPGISIYWIFDSYKSNVPSYIHQVKKNSLLEYLFTLATATVYVDNMRFSSIKKGKNQLFIQTWHGDRAFKKVLCDSPFSTGSNIQEAIPGYCDLAIAGSDYGERKYRSAFRYNGEVLKVGTPRDDILVERSLLRIHEIKKQLSVEIDTRVLLYAPTLRRENQKDGTVQKIQEIDIEKTLNALEHKYNCKWVCLMRAHPSIQNLGGYAKSNRILDVAKYEDMADLLLISDMLITDYSSSAGDFALLDRPIVLFQSDVNEYVEKDRSFYFDMNDSPYYIAHCQAELEALISDFEDERIKNNCKDILAFYGTNETGHSAEAVARRIVDFCKKG